MKLIRPMIALFALSLLCIPTTAQDAELTQPGVAGGDVLGSSHSPTLSTLSVLAPAEALEVRVQEVEAPAPTPEATDLLTDSPGSTTAAVSYQGFGISPASPVGRSVLAVSSDECFHDLDCNWDEFCHKMGVNDCRDEKEEGAVCSRHGKCLSGCCRVHISWPFQKTCRPASSCQ